MIKGQLNEFFTNQTLPKLTILSIILQLTMVFIITEIQSALY